MQEDGGVRRLVFESLRPDQLKPHLFCSLHRLSSGVIPGVSWLRHHHFQGISTGEDQAAALEKPSKRRKGMLSTSRMAPMLMSIQRAAGAEAMAPETMSRMPTARVESRMMKEEESDCAHETWPSSGVMG